jgi:pyruvate/2-oxoglutarate dehydrogenase complex dihydrolipoamide acyltransferase (E2) component
MPEADSLRRLGGGRWETRDGRFAIEPQSGTWVIVDGEQTDELGLPLVRGPFGSLTAAREAIEAARSGGPAASPLAGRIEQARQADRATPKASTPPGAASRKPATAKPEPKKPEPPPEPRWLRDLEPSDRRRARDLVARLEKMGIADAGRIARAEVADGQPAVARLALERAIARAIASAEDPTGAARGTVKAILRGADVELGVSWRLVDDDGRRIEKLDIPE